MIDRYSLDSLDIVGGDGAAGRNDSRDSLFLAAKLTVGTLPPEQVRVRNLSAGGMMAEYPAAIEANTRVRIELRGIGEIGGRIAWATDGRIGIAFDTPINPLNARKPVATRSAKTR